MFWLFVAACAARHDFHSLEIFFTEFPIVGNVFAAHAGTPLALDLVRVPGGTFTMGSREGGENAAPHEVSVSDFHLGRTEVTIQQYGLWPGAHGDEASPQGDLPVAHVSYDEAESYCAWLSKETGRKVRLPTEAEWEYAARGGVHGARFPWGWGKPDGLACFGAASAGRVGSYEPNRYGLFDMAGNVAEWCAPAETHRAVARGGSWADRDPRFLRVFERRWFDRDYRDADVGFRILVEADRPVEAPAD